jgi:hypothetical protein
MNHTIRPKSITISIKACNPKNKPGPQPEFDFQRVVRYHVGNIVCLRLVCLLDAAPFVDEHVWPNAPR